MIGAGDKPRTDNSVQFSLTELLKLEDQRVEEEELARQAREAAALAERLEAERQANAAIEEAAKKHALAEEEKRRVLREEEARREAIKAAAIEQAKVEVETHARAIETERMRRHEIELVMHRTTGKGTPSVAMLFGCTMLGGILMLAVLLGVHLGVSKPAADRQLADLETRMTAAEKKTDDANQRAEELKTQLRAAELDRNEARAEIARLKSKPGVNPAPPTTTPAPTVAPKPLQKKEKEPTCDPKDPMCFALPRAT